MTGEPSPQHDLGDALARAATVQRIIAARSFGESWVQDDLDALHLNVARVEEALRALLGNSR